MKPIGSTLSYSEQRDAELYDAYKKALPYHTNEDGTIDYMGAITAASRTPCSRFWISEGMAYNKIRWMQGNPKACDNMISSKRNMYKDLFRIFTEMKADPEYAGFTDKEIAYLASDHEAPEFYLTPGSAKIHICAERKRRLLKRLHIR